MRYVKCLFKTAVMAGVLVLGQTASAQQAIKIGVINLFSSPLGLYGVKTTPGFERAVDQANAAGGLLERKIDLVHDAILKMVTPEGSYTTGFGVKFDQKLQNLRTAQNMPQWQSGKVVTVFSTQAILPGVTLKNLART